MSKKGHRSNGIDSVSADKTHSVKIRQISPFTQDLIHNITVTCAPFDEGESN